MNRLWRAALSVNPARRDREAVIAAAIHLAMLGKHVRLDALPDPEMRRRAGYLMDLAQLMRGQRADEAAVLDRVRTSLPRRSPEPFWPGETPSPAGVDPVAEKWGYTRGVNVLRLRAALQATKKGDRIRILPRVREKII
jgi:hypothetical protein